MKGRAWVYGDDVNTDVIIPGRYLYLNEPRALADHALEDLDPAFATGVRKGDVIVAGRNFGCGSSREQAVSCLVAAGVGAIIARSFARIFYRNGINLGLPLVMSSRVGEMVEQGHEVRVDLEGGFLENLTRAVKVDLEPLPDKVKEILGAGGLIPLIKGRLENRVIR